MQNNDGFFMRQFIFSKIHYKHEIYSGEFFLMLSKSFIQAQNEQQYYN